MSWITADSIRSKILTPQVLERRGFGDDGTPLVGNDKTFGNRISALAKQNTAAADREASEDTKNVRRRAIEIREKKTDGNRIGQIWIKMSPTDPRRTQIVNVRDELTNFSTDQPEIYEFLTTGNSNSLKTSYEITKGTGDPGPSGLQWINSNDSAKEGTEFTTELSNSALQDDILAKREAITEYDASADLSTHEFDFTAEEWAKYQIDNLTYDHFVEVTKNGIVYKYQPLQPKATKAHTINKYHIVDADVTEDYIEVPGTGTEYVLIGTEANDAEDISGLSGLNYGDWFSHNGYVWVLSRSTEDERQYQRDNEKNVRELRRRCIRIREKKTDGNRIGQIWIKMKENDPRRTTTVNIGSPLTLDATQDEPLIDVLKNNAGAFLSGHTYYGKFFVVDSKIDSEHNYIVRNSPTGFEYVFDEGPVSIHAGTTLKYGDFYQDGDDVWVVSRSTEDERQYQRDNEKNVRELRRRCIRIREKKTDGNKIGQIWIKMKENDPRRTNGVNVGTNITGTLNNGSYDDLVDVLKNEEDAFDSTHNYYGKYFVVDSKIDSEHNYVVRKSPTGFEYVFDEGNVPTIANLKYGDFYKVGDYVWVVSRSTEDERQYQRDNEKNVRELRRRCIRIREKSSTIGQIWIKMKSYDPRRTVTVNIGDEVSPDNDTIQVLTNNVAAFDSAHAYYGKYFVVDSKIDSEHNYVVRNSPTGFEYVFDEGNVPTIANLKYGDYYQSGDDVWVVSRSTEEEREYQRVIEKEVKELRRSCIRHRENSTTIGQIWVKEPADAVEIQGYKYVNKTSDLDAKLKAVFDNNSAVFATGHDYYRQFFVVDSHIDSEHDYVVRDSPSGITYVFNDMSMTELAKFNSGAVGEIVLDYGNYYQKAGEDYRFVVSRSTEVMREYMKSIEVSREAAREMYRLQEGISLLNNLEAWDPENRIGRIWIYVSNTTLPSTDKEITDSIYPGFPGSLMNGVSSGYSWYDAGASEPGTGTEITDTKLAAALALRQDFTPSEWNSFGITGLTNDHYILVGSNYYKPVPGKLIYTSEELDQYGLNTIDSTYWVRNTGTTAPRNLGYYIPSYHINQNYKNLQYPSNVLNNILGRVWLKVDKIPTGGNAYTSNSLKGELDNGTLSFTLDKLDELDIVSAYSSGLNWEKVNTLPSSGILFTDSDLKTLLEADGGNSITIDKSDWDNSVVDIGLTENHYIAAIIGGNNVYYKPVNKNTLNNTHYIVGATGYYVPGYWVNSTFKDAYYPLVDPV